MYESRHHPLISRQQFVRRLIYAISIGIAIIVISLVIGMAGYRISEGMSWTDAFVNAAMILSGMGPLNPLNTAGGKIFAGCYALYSGLALITVAGVIFAPVFHRFLHKFHIEASK